jgi:succinate dehydrogenase / fumarate reductase flavoprotein subunit
MESGWRKTLLVCRAEGETVVPDIAITKQDQVPMRDDLLELIDIEELEKYFTPEELANHSSRRNA